MPLVAFQVKPRHEYEHSDEVQHDKNDCVFLRSRYVSRDCTRNHIGNCCEIAIELGIAGAKMREIISRKRQKERLFKHRLPSRWREYVLCYVAGMSLTRIAGLSELPPEGELREFPFGSASVCVANSGGIFTALGNVCPHKGGPLSEGVIESGRLVCPWHGWEFVLSNGRCVNRPGASVKLFELVIHGDDVFLKS